MQPFSNDPSMVLEAQELTLSQFENSPLFLGMINAFVSPLQDLQDTLYSILTQTFVTNAVGYQLDIIGQYVGLARQGFGDDIYRLFIQVKIAINNSQGTPNQIITIMMLITGATNCLYLQYQPASMDLQVNVDLAPYLAGIGLSQQAFIDLIQTVIPAGVLLFGISSYDGPATAFGWFEDPDALGFDQGELAYNLY